MRERFPNLKKIKKVSCPTLIIHGKADTVIPYQQAEALHKANPDHTQLILINEMTHNRFHLLEDIFEPFRVFLLDKLR